MVGVVIHLLHKDDYYDEPIMQIFITAFLLILGILMVIFPAFDLHLLHKYPEISAYKMIFGWFHG